MDNIGGYYLLYFVLFIDVVKGDYCEFGTCQETVEYCCGENKCCHRSGDVWYYWAAALLIIISMIVATFLYLRSLKNKYKRYMKLEEVVDDVSTVT